MSNCVEIENPGVVFSTKDIDAAGLKALLDRAPKGRIPAYGEVEYVPEEAAAAWFLVGAVEFLPTGEVLYRIGRGRSGHTWRDLRGTLQVLQPFMRREKRKVFTARDESDGFKRPFRLEIIFGRDPQAGGLKG
jgi:hypothetical protein